MSPPSCSGDESATANGDDHSSSFVVEVSPKLSVVICMVKHDDYMTPFSAWEDVSAYIPRHLTLWEAFYGDGTSGHHLTELGFDVIHEDVDFFTHDLGECVVTNPPFSELPRVLARLRELGKPSS